MNTGLISDFIRSVEDSAADEEPTPTKNSSYQPLAAHARASSMQACGEETWDVCQVDVVNRLSYSQVLAPNSIYGSLRARTSIGRRGGSGPSI